MFTCVSPDESKASCGAKKIRGPHEAESIADSRKKTAIHAKSQTLLTPADPQIILIYWDVGAASQRCARGIARHELFLFFCAPVPPTIRSHISCRQPQQHNRHSSQSRGWTATPCKHVLRKILSERNTPRDQSPAVGTKKNLKKKIQLHHFHARFDPQTHFGDHRWGGEGRIPALDNHSLDEDVRRQRGGASRRQHALFVVQPGGAAAAGR